MKRHIRSRTFVESQRPAVMEEESVYKYTLLDTVAYGRGTVDKRLPDILGDFGIHRVLIVTGKSLKTKTPVIGNIEKLLGNCHRATFSGIGEHAPIDGIEAAVKLVFDKQCDAIVSVGGGSPIDATKAIIHQYHSKQNGWIPHIAIPTTLSAAEYTSLAGFTDQDGMKKSVAEPQLAPKAILLDSTLTVHTPERLWLSTGMRAVDHAVETLYRDKVPAPTKHLAYAALADLFKYMPLSKQDPANLEYRQALQVASWMSLFPTTLEGSSSVGLSHTLGHKLGATYHIPHGITSCLTLAQVVRYEARNLDANRKQWLAGAASHIGLHSSGDATRDCLQLADAIDSLVEILGLKSTLAEYNVPKDDLRKIANRATGTEQGPEFSAVVDILDKIYS